MEESVRLQYLEAMGIDVWISRRPPAPLPVVEEPESLGWASQSDDHQHTASDLAKLADSPTAGESREASESWHETTPSDAASEILDAMLAETAPPPPAPPIHHHQDPAWKDLQHEVAICRACALCETRTQTVFGVGNKHATWMLIGEAPGQNEDLQGEPFVGRAGQLLNEMLRAIGLQRELVYIANILKCRPPNNRDPQADEVAACHGFLQRQIALLQPKIILAVGRIAAQNLLETQQPLAKLRGVRHQLNDIPLIVIHHPAYLLRSLPEKAKAWEDLKFALSVYQELERNHVETHT